MLRQNVGQFLPRVESMSAKGTGFLNRHARTIEVIFAITCGAVLIYALADWQKWLPGERGFQPFRLVLLSAAMVLQPVAALVRDRSRGLFWVLLLVSITLLAATFLVAS